MSLFLILTATILMGCQFLDVIHTVADFEERNRNPHQFGTQNFQPPQISGMRLISDIGVDFAHDFRGWHTFVVKNSEHFILSRNGEFVRSKNLFGRDIAYGKFIFSENGLYGVKNIFFEVLVEPQNYYLRIVGENMLSKRYYGYSEALFNLELEPLYIYGFRQLTPFVNSVAKIHQDGYVGFFNKNENILVSPVFWTISEFSRGYAIASVGNERKIISKTGFQTSVPQNINPRYFNGEILLAVSNNGSYKLLDKNFNEISNTRFPFNSRLSIFHDLVFFQFGDVFGFYDIARTGTLSAGYFENVFHCQNFLVLKNFHGEYALFDSNLNRLRIFDFVSFSHGTMKIRGGYQYFFYEII
ncbi:MAG: hypothetical protein FWC11_02885 [Firmicutes bacterium]|nr:hypothetical protein [Bacillota bacterium]